MKILRGTVFGAIAYFLIGWLVWGILLMDFLSGNMNQCANRPDNGMIWWAIIASNFVLTLLLTLVLNWAKAKSITDGLKYGALFGLLYTLSFSLSSWSMTTMYTNIGALLTDTLASTVVMAVIGMVIVLTWGKEKQEN
jgi:glycopeptide antibiotics resistance protein